MISPLERIGHEWMAGPWLVRSSPFPGGLFPRFGRRDFSPYASELTERLDVEVLAARTPLDPEPVARIEQIESVRTVARFHLAELDFDWLAGRARWWWSTTPLADPMAMLMEPCMLTSLQVLAIRSGGFVMHGAAVMGDGQAVVISGRSGAGKSTLAKRFPDRYIHDDVCAVVPSPSGWDVWFQTGYRSPTHTLTPKIPLRALFFLSETRSRSQCQRLAHNEAMAALAGQLFFAGPTSSDMLLDRAARIAVKMPVYTLDHCLKDDVQVLDKLLFA